MTNVASRKGVPSGTRIRDGTLIESKNNREDNKVHNINTILDCEVGYITSSLIFHQYDLD